MDLWEAVVVAFRRWYVTIPLLVVGVIGAFVLAGAVDPTYRAEAEVQYIRPPLDPEDESAALRAQSNPFYGDLNQLKFATESAARSDAIADDLDRAGLSASYTVEADGRQPRLYVTAESTRPALAIDTLNELVVMLDQEAERLQVESFGEANEEFFVRSISFSDSEPALDVTSRTRARILLLVVAVLLAFGIPVLFDGVMAARRRDRQAPDAAAANQEVVWFGVPMQGNQQMAVGQAGNLASSPPPTPVPEEPRRGFGSSSADDGEAPPDEGRRDSRWSR